MSDQPTYNVYPGSQGHQGNMQQLTDTKVLLRNMELNLRREFVNSRGDIVSRGRPLMNERGIADIRGVVESIANQVNILGRLEDYEVKEEGVTTLYTLASLLMVNHRDYAIDQKYTNNVRSQILTISMNVCHAVLTRARKGDDKRFWKSSSTEQRTILTEDKPPQQRGVWSSPFKK